MGNQKSSRASSAATTNNSHLNADGTWTPIRDRFHSLEDVQRGLRAAGLESSNLIVGIDLTKSNEWQGKRTFQGRCLHTVGLHGILNPYEHSLGIISRALAPFDDDDLIPAYGFGDASTNDHSVLAFSAEGDAPQRGLRALLQSYRAVIPHVKLAGPTSFGPIIRRAVDIVAADGGYHILLIVADGAITRGSHLAPNQKSSFEQDTISAIVEASNYPLSIVVVGVGDGPWEQMVNFDDGLPQRRYDNFQFVQFHKLTQSFGGQGGGQGAAEMEAQFALDALMEIPEQFNAIQRLGLLNRGALRPPNRDPSRVVAPPAGALPGLRAVEAGGAAAMAAAVPGAAAVPVVAGASGSTAGAAGHANNVPVMLAPQIPMATAVAAEPAVPGLASASSSSHVIVPDLFRCPLTGAIMRDPVQCMDGHTYERTAIEGWITRSQTSPKTGQPLPGSQLFPNMALQAAIQEFCAKNPGLS